LFVMLPVASCAVGAGGTIGLHYTTDHSVRVQLEVPLEVDLVGAGTTAAAQGRPYMRAAVVPQLAYDVSSSSFDGGVRIALGPVFGVGGSWLAPAFTIGGSGFSGKGSGFSGKDALDVGFTMDLEIPYSNDASCSDLRFNNLLVPQVSLARRVYDVDHPLSSAGGDWDVGIAVGVRHTRFVTCAGASSAPPAMR